MITRIRIPFQDHEFHALVEASRRDLRPVDLQAKWFVVEALKQRGLLPPDQDEDSNGDPEKQ